MTPPPTTALVTPEELAGVVAGRVAGGERFAGLFATAQDDGSTVIRALLARHGSLDIVQAALMPGRDRYPAITPLVPPAAWYEREIHDLFGIEPVGHPSLDPLLVPVHPTQHWRPRPGTSRPGEAVRLDFDTSPLSSRVAGQGLFTIPYGPVRSGVFESVEYLVETFGEDIPYLRSRVHYKHRGIERRFGELGVDDGVLLAERVEGTAAVAHALAYCQALEALGAIHVPRRAGLVRVVHAELERVASHLDSVARQTEGAGQAVAYARITLHKERVQRLRSQLCGHRFGRGVVVPGGVAGPLSAASDEALRTLRALERGITDDARALMDTPSFLDRLRHTGVVSPAAAASHGALGPVGRGSGLGEDVRSDRPYGAYSLLGFQPAETSEDGDALARQQIRLDEITTSFHLIREALDELGEEDADGPWRLPMQPVEGIGLGWVEAPQGELVYLVEAEAGRLKRVKQRSASFHNLALFPQAFGGDILTDFVFIEASFGLSISGVAG
ncbi:MAG: NADH-quinone oxidoreductase subunit C [Acidimicrobiales bacterium]|jgi:Ni,Fe-hydrogenase III large subunit